MAAKMKMFLICDNPDTATGLRLAGIEGIIVKDEQSASDALNTVLKDENVSVILMNQTLCSGCESTIRAFRRAHQTPVITEIPDRNAKKSGSTLAEYIRETTGVGI